MEFKLINEGRDKKTREEVRLEIAKFFKDPIMTKYQNDQKSRLGIYGILIISDLQDGYRYLLAMVKEEDGAQMQLEHRVKLSKLQWINIQTRIYKNPNLSIKESMSFKNDRTLPYEFKVKSRSISKITYNSFILPLSLDLIPTGKKPSEYEYSDKPRLDSALETFNCSVTLL